MSRLRVLSMALLTAAAVPAAMLMGGCGGASSVDPTAMAAAAGATARAGGADIAIAGTMKISQLPRPIRFTATGQTSSNSRQAHLRMDMSDLGRLVPQAGSPSNWKIELILDMPVIYMRFPILSKQFGKPWVKEDFQKVAGSLGISSPGLFQGTQNPRQFVDYLRSVKAGVKKVGTTTVRGVKTTHYKATLDLRNYPDRLPPSQRAQARAAIEKLIQLTGTSSYPVEVWIDSKNLVRRIALSYSIKLPNTTQRMSFGETTDIYDYGLKPQIKPPPAGQVKDITSLAQQQAQSTIR